MDTRQPITPDVENYKMNRIQEHPLDSRQKHLDVLCFPNLFPTGEFGQFHSQQKNLDPSEYIKSRLLNKDSRYRKDDQFDFFHQMRKPCSVLRHIQLTEGVHSQSNDCSHPAQSSQPL